jgi:hypothetical protein
LTPVVVSDSRENRPHAGLDDGMAERRYAGGEGDGAFIGGSKLRLGKAARSM